jgi:hypothetical protein
VVGGLIGALVGMWIPEYEARRYEGLVKAGPVLLSVHSDSSDWVKMAKDTLKLTGADGILSSDNPALIMPSPTNPRIRRGGMV